MFEQFFFPFRLEICTPSNNRPQRHFTEVVLEKCTFKSSILKSMHSCYIIISLTKDLEQWKQEYVLIALLTLKTVIVTLQTFRYPSTPYWRKDNTRHKSWNTCVIFSFPNFDLGVTVISMHQNTRGSTLGWKRAYFSENKGVKTEYKKFGENSRDMASVSTICDEYCRILMEQRKSGRL